MTKAEFLSVLEAELASASPEERVAALQYYSEYLAEAGPEREEQVIAELGSPRGIAAGILEAGGALRIPAPPAAAGGPAGGREAPTVLPDTAPVPSQGGFSPGNTAVLRAVIYIMLLIILLPLVGGLAAGLVGVLAGVAATFVSVLAAGVAMLGGGVVSLIMSVIILPLSLGNALVAMGSGLFITALGLLAVYAGVRLLGRVLPAIIRWLVKSGAALFAAAQGLITGVKGNG